MIPKATMYRQGRGWVVSAWCPTYRAYWVSAEMSYWVARSLVTQANRGAR